MLSVLLAANAADGHVAPMLGVAKHFVAAGIRVRFLTGDRFADAVRATGAVFVPWPEAAQIDHQRVIADTVEGGGPTAGTAGMAAGIDRLFIRPAPAQYEALRRETDAERTDAVLAEFTVVGAAALAVSSAPRPPVIACGILPLGLTSVDTAPWGLGILPRMDAIGRLRNRVLNAAARYVVLRTPQRQTERMVRALSGERLGVFFMDWAVRADRYVQFTVPGFEYPRRDLSDRVSFIGPVAKRPARAATRPSWWADLDDAPRIVHVTQGTVANEDPEQLILPAVRALADSPALVVVSTGGRPVSSLGALPSNARAAEFLPYDELLPRTDVFVTNGGYGGLHYALGSGVPLVVAGDSEDKVETTRRVEWSGAGINLRTGRPTEDAVRVAVDRVLGDPSYRTRARELQAEIAASPGAAGLERLVRELAAR